MPNRHQVVNWLINQSILLHLITFGIYTSETIQTLWSAHSEIQTPDIGSVLSVIALVSPHGTAVSSSPKLT
jgi:hypothetical protein